METLDANVEKKLYSCTRMRGTGNLYTTAGTVDAPLPVCRAVKQSDRNTRQRSILFELEYPKIEDYTEPMHNVVGVDEKYQCVQFAAKPYKMIGFKVPSTEIVKFFHHWNPDSKIYTVQVHFKAMPLKTIEPPSTAETRRTSPPQAPSPSQ